MITDNDSNNNTINNCNNYKHANDNIMIIILTKVVITVIVIGRPGPDLRAQPAVRRLRQELQRPPLRLHALRQRHSPIYIYIYVLYVYIYIYINTYIYIYM